MYLSLSEKQESRLLEEMFSGLIICGSPCSFGKFHREGQRSACREGLQQRA